MGGTSWWLQPPPILADGVLQGQIMQHDHFGNLRTNITTAAAEQFLSAGQVTVGIRRQQTTLCRMYADAPPGSLLALFDRAGFLELAVNRGNAALASRSCCWPESPCFLRCSHLFSIIEKEEKISCA
jgi:S-adenosylmethionine hydrolase